MTTNYVNIPLFADPFYSYSISLEGNSYILQFLYNERAELYYLSLFDVENNPLVQGEALVPNYPIFKDYAILALNGWFWLEEKADIITEPYKTYPDKLNEYYNMYYIYNTED